MSPGRIQGKTTRPKKVKTSRCLRGSQSYDDQQCFGNERHELTAHHANTQLSITVNHSINALVISLLLQNGEQNICASILID